MEILLLCNPLIIFFNNRRRELTSIEFDIGSAATIIGVILGIGGG